MYFLFVNHHWSPSVYFDAPAADKLLIRAFAEREAEEAEEERKRYET